MNKNEQDFSQLSGTFPNDIVIKYGSIFIRRDHSNCGKTASMEIIYKSIIHAMACTFVVTVS